MERMVTVGQYTFNSKFCLGEGSFGKVYQATSSTGQKVAVKKIDARMLEQDQYLRTSIQLQIQILKKFNHPNIVKLHDAIFSKNNVYLITQYCQNGDLKEYARKIRNNQPQILKLCRDVLSGMKEIHAKKIIHRDIKPANILINKGVFKIADFGLARRTRGIMSNQTIVGTPMYMAPQLLRRQEYSDRCDVWSFGVLLYQVMFGSLPWRANNQQQLLRMITSRTPSYPKGQISDCLMQLVQKCLQVEQEKRWNWNDIDNHLNKSGKSSSLNALARDFQAFRVGDAAVLQNPILGQSRFGPTSQTVISKRRKIFRDQSSQQQESSQKRRVVPVAKNKLAVETEVLPPKPSARSDSLFQNDLKVIQLLKQIIDSSDQRCRQFVKFTLSYLKLKFLGLSNQTKAQAYQDCIKCLNIINSMDRTYKLSIPIFTNKQLDMAAHLKEQIRKRIGESLRQLQKVQLKQVKDSESIMAALKLVF